MTVASILIVEDEIALAEVVRDYLLVERMHVDMLTSGAGAVELIQAKQYDLVILDLMLPEVDGLTICRELRKASDVPIIMTTAKVEEIDRLLGLEMGADDYLCKPYSPRELVARVRAVLRRRPLGRPAENPATNDRRQRLMAASSTSRGGNSRFCRRSLHGRAAFSPAISYFRSLSLMTLKFSTEPLIVTSETSGERLHR